MGTHPTKESIKSPSSLVQLRNRALELSQSDDVLRRVEGVQTEVDGKRFYKIENVDQMDPFFMSMVSAGNHWLFLASSGAITCGRRDSNSSLFPYYSSDKLLDFGNSTGPLTIVQVELEGATVNWEPFTNHANPLFDCSRHVYKNTLGSEVIFEEFNHTLNLLFRFSWRAGDRFGFIRNCHLANFGSNIQHLRLLDGLQNLVPSGLGSDFQLRFSNLGDAYKKNERLANSPLAVFYLSSVPTDCAEPSEGLTATTVWQTGLDDPCVLLSPQQLDRFRKGDSVKPEIDVRGKRACYLAVQPLELPAQDSISWTMVADVDRDQSDVIELRTLSVQSAIGRKLRDDFDANEVAIQQIMSMADANQCGELFEQTDRHHSNVTFNVMRGGVPLRGYRVELADFLRNLEILSRASSQQWSEEISKLGEADVELSQLVAFAESTDDANLIRIAREYLPLAYSRRHGDPTRPWNIFSVDTRHEDGSTKLNYQGNWRDIFQNWEALGLSFPRYLTSMVLRFVNASTMDGHNPYRLTKNGFDWERPDPNDPWANIGYWGDHQIIYQLKLIEHARACQAAESGELDQLLNRSICVFADVPYRINNYDAMLVDSQNTISFDHDLDATVEKRVAEKGADGQLVHDQDGNIVRVTLFEKLMLSGLTKVANLIPDAGIWLNTQRPEWNDANNALVGNGTSVVTTCYLRRYFNELADWIGSQGQSLNVSQTLFSFYQSVATIFAQSDAESLTPQSRRQLVDQLQTAASDYRHQVYTQGVSAERVELATTEFVKFSRCCVNVLEQTIAANRREDGLYHAYNLVSFGTDSIEIEYLYEMLEGQVAVLSSGMLSPQEVVEVLNSLRNSKIYREDQNSYMLYPDRQLPRFLEKNRIDRRATSDCELLLQLESMGESSILKVDLEGDLRFHGSFRNVNDLRDALTQLRGRRPEFAELIDRDLDLACEVFESTFDHHRFTGRSGTFFGYEGLGSIYWHMVSKLALAVLENYQLAITAQDPVAEALGKQYREIKLGIGVSKHPAQYGAFPTDPYSHSPSGQGVKQPGMTGQVKEDILSRFMELGVRIEAGCLRFETSLFPTEEWLTEPREFSFFDVQGTQQHLQLDAGQFGFTFAQVPVVFTNAQQPRILITRVGGEVDELNSLSLSAKDSQDLFERTHQIIKIEVQFPSETNRQ